MGVIFIGEIERGAFISLQVKTKILRSPEVSPTASQAHQQIMEALKNNKKVLLCGKGGLAADAQHIATELLGGFHFDREPVFAEPWYVNTSYLTVVRKDYCHDETLARLVKASGTSGDILISNSMSGESTSVV